MKLDRRIERRITMGEHIKRTLNGFAVSFTVVVVINIVPALFGGGGEFSAWELFMVLVTCAAVAAAHFLIGLLPIESLRGLIALYMLAMYAIVFLLGIFAFHFFTSLRGILCWIVFLLITFLAVLFVTYVEDWNKAREINRMIEKKKRG